MSSDKNASAESKNKGQEQKANPIGVVVISFQLERFAELFLHSLFLSLSFFLYDRKHTHTLGPLVLASFVCVCAFESSLSPHIRVINFFLRWLSLEKSTG